MDWFYNQQHLSCDHSLFFKLILCYITSERSSIPNYGQRHLTSYILHVTCHNLYLIHLIFIHYHNYKSLYLNNSIWYKFWPGVKTKVIYNKIMGLWVLHATTLLFNPPSLSRVVKVLINTLFCKPSSKFHSLVLPSPTVCYLDKIFLLKPHISYIFNFPGTKGNILYPYSIWLTLIMMIREGMNVLQVSSLRRW